MNFRPTRLEAVTVIAGATQLAIAGIVATQATTGPVPMHFGLLGGVDRWGDRDETAGLILFMAALTLLGGGFLAWRARRAPEGRRGLGWAQGLLLATTCLLTAQAVVMAGGVTAADAPRASLLGLSLLLAVLGAFLGKVGPNPLVGVRTPWSRASRLAWERSNRLAGRLLFWLGVAGLVLTPALPVEHGHWLVGVGVFLSAALSVFESWRVWRNDPERIRI